MISRKTKALTGLLRNYFEWIENLKKTGINLIYRDYKNQIYNRKLQ